MVSFNALYAFSFARKNYFSTGKTARLVLYTCINKKKKKKTRKEEEEEKAAKILAPPSLPPPPCNGVFAPVYVINVASVGGRERGGRVVEG